MCKFHHLQAQEKYEEKLCMQLTAHENQCYAQRSDLENMPPNLDF